MTRLLTEAEGDPVAIENAEAAGDFLFVCEHASNRMPERLGTLGLSGEALESHIAWDPGALAVSRLLSKELDGTLIHQRFSRLAYDCNRPPEAAAAMPSVSETYEVPGNVALSAAERQARIQEIYLPFHAAVTRAVADRKAARRGPVLVTIHSFTPIYFGKPRTVELGILHDADSRLAERMLAAAATAEAGYDVRRNEPYGPADGVTHSLIEYGIRLGVPNVMIEIRNDLIRDKVGQRVMADYLAGLLATSAVALPAQ
ncbi:MAG: N-formylglutamate amidohydrolase [Sinorhizobium meliloti]|uniref:N-formylglutamate amidohydrolase n=1 Tax=Sinorhizobium TaxID=28105 RepID=UPI000361A70F|nr:MULTISPECIES: N-formylglutamate amidohydrolase [Sinorhizobium]MCG5482413.1 N-formylglutamate amidohydrolase [Sinorhizobium meliloti]PND23538.1 N-formylglutamate amidohydrolase [Ensifer sp. MMN_5]PND28851.1 N-formylglutamate amidohydrolase [Sinorhizobium sp. M4_45]RVP98987.1 N-formylglutamate amidohydrolase [Sinorhizobium meliloti]